MSQRDFPDGHFCPYGPGHRCDNNPKYVVGVYSVKFEDKRSMGYVLLQLESKWRQSSKAIIEKVSDYSDGI